MYINVISPVCSVKLDRDRNSVMKKSDIEHMVNWPLLYAVFSTFLKLDLLFIKSY